MPLPDDNLEMPALLRVQLALKLTQKELGKRLLVSRRTIIRWMQSPELVPASLLEALVTEVHAKDPTAAARVATSLGKSLESLGILPPAPPIVAQPAPAPTPLPATPAPLIVLPRHLADSIVCAAAEAVGLAPQAIRPALIAAFERAAHVGLTAEEARVLLSPEQV